MHYKNGRPAKAGDRVICVVGSNQGISGILHTTNAQSDSCNGRLAVTSSNDPYVTIGECLHVDDVAAATIPDTSAPLPAA
jgi:hypothetical protein